MHYFKKNLLKFSSGHIHSILGPILKTWVPFYSLEHKEFENLLSSSYSNVFIRNVRFVCAWLKIANFWRFSKRKQLHTTVYFNV